MGHLEAWAGRVQEEFVAQVESEEALGLPVSKYLTENKPKLETGFMNVFARPLWSKLQGLLPEILDRVEDLTANYTTWQNQLEEIAAAAAAKE